MTYPSRHYARCWRCGGGITENSVFAVEIWRQDERIRHDVVFANKLHGDSVAVHMGGDRECRREVSGYHGKILKWLDLPMSCDTSFLEKV